MNSITEFAILNIVTGRVGISSVNLAFEIKAIVLTIFKSLRF